MKHGHDDLRDNYDQMRKLIHPSISCEPVKREGGGLHTQALVGDLVIVGLWEGMRF